MPRNRSPRRSSDVRLRAGVFAILALVLVGGAAYALWPRELPVVEAATSSGPGPGAQKASQGAVDLTLRIDMSGFTPATFTIPANRPVRVRIVNPDNSHHSDGGGIHQFAIDKLGVNAKIQPETVQIVTIPAAAEGEYAFYCDTCCGGKENPSMQGVVKVKA